jgi:hypothetical protein
VDEYFITVKAPIGGGVVPAKERQKNKITSPAALMAKKKVDSDSEDSFINDDESEDEVLLSLYEALFS